MGLLLEFRDVLPVGQLLPEQRRRKRVEQSLGVAKGSQPRPEAVEHLGGAVRQPDQLVDAGQLDELVRRVRIGKVLLVGRGQIADVDRISLVRLAEARLGVELAQERRGQVGARVRANGDPEQRVALLAA